MQCTAVYRAERSRARKRIVRVWATGEGRTRTSTSGTAAFSWLLLVHVRKKMKTAGGDEERTVHQCPLNCCGHACGTSTPAGLERSFGVLCCVRLGRAHSSWRAREHTEKSVASRGFWVWGWAARVTGGQRRKARLPRSLHPSALPHPHPSPRLRCDAPPLALIASPCPGPCGR